MTVPIDTSTFRMTDDKRSRLDKLPTRMTDGPGKKALKESVEADRERIADLQPALYAEGERSLLLIFQAMDAAGKDSCIAHVLSGVNPQGCSVTAFKSPSKEELAHDFLWRHAKAMPERGMIGVHNRSHYEEVLIVKVHPEHVIGQHLPGVRRVKDIDAAFWERRYGSIDAFERHLADQGTVVLKFFLHMSKAVQKERFLERIAETDKQWKFNAGDIGERAHWDAYMKAYEEMVHATSHAHAPWFVVPADEQWESRAIVCRIVRETLEEMAPEPRALDAKGERELAEAKAALKKE
jgi:PPK2 family polyphosphate:nucleotide phosphotransferase